MSDNKTKTKKNLDGDYIYDDLDIDTLLDQRGRLEDALQSNFRATTLLSDVPGFVITLQKLTSLCTDTNSDPVVLGLLNKMTAQTLDILSQVTYTGRCLGGALNPSASLYTDQRAKTLKKKALAVTSDNHNLNPQKNTVSGCLSR
jgi:hypothetical protein